MHRDHVRLDEQLLQGHQGHPVGRGVLLGEVRIVGQQAVAEGGGAPGHHAGDGAEAEEAERLRREAPDGRLPVRPAPALLPLSAAHVAVADQQLLVGRQDQAQGVVGHFLAEGVGDVGEEDPLGGEGVDVDVVVADVGAQDEARLGQLPGLVRAQGHAPGDDHVRLGHLRRDGPAVVLEGRHPQVDPLRQQSGVGRVLRVDLARPGGWRRRLSPAPATTLCPATWWGGGIRRSWP